MVKPAHRFFRENQKCPICNKIMLDPRTSRNADTFSRDHILPRCRRPKDHFEYTGNANRHRVFKFICSGCNVQRAAADHCFAILQIAVDHGITDHKKTMLLCKRTKNPTVEIFNGKENCYV